MIEFKTLTIDKDQVKRQFEALPQRLENVRKALGAQIASEIRDDVRKRLPGSDGWLGIYRDAIDFYNDGKEWVVAGDKEVDMTILDAEITLLTFAPDDAPSKILAQYNPWPLDLVPALTQSYVSRVSVQPNGEGDVVARRAALVPILPQIITKLTQAGYAVQQYGLAQFNGRVTADLNYLSKKLEYGFAPMPRVPHWRPAADNISRTLKEAVAATKEKFEAILKGNIPVIAKPMSSNLKSAVAASVRQQLPKVSS